MFARIASAARAAPGAPCAGSPIAPKIAMRPSPVNLSRIPPASITDRAMTRRYAFTTDTACSGDSFSASAVEPRRSAKRIVTVCRSPSRRSGSPPMTRSTTVGGRKRSRPRRRSSSRNSAPSARTVAANMSPWYSHHESVQTGPRNCESCACASRTYEAGEGSLHREPGAHVVAALRPRGNAVERRRAARHQIRDEAGAAEQVRRDVPGAAVCDRVVARVRAAADQDPARDAAKAAGQPIATTAYAPIAAMTRASSVRGGTWRSRKDAADV